MFALYASQVEFTDYVYLYLVEEKKDGTKRLIQIDKPDIEIAEGAKYPEPTFKLNIEEVDALVNQLAYYGFYSRHLKTDSAVIEAKNAHIRDLQALIFNFKIERDK